MDESTVIQIAVMAMETTAKVAAPILVVSLLIGFTVSILQSVTQIQEMTLAFVPKLAGVGVTIVVAGSWMMAQLEGFTRSLFDLIPSLLH
jgi:flagellar biosynthetic protein FliQ